MKVPFVDLKIQYNSIREEVNLGIAEVVENTDFVGGNRVKRFESDFAAMCGIQNCVSVGNGTDAIYVALKMPGIGPEDEVITVANTWISTSESITQTGATPVFVDIEPDFYTIDVKCVEAAITEKTKGIIPVHLYCQMANMHELKKITERHSPEEFPVAYSYQSQILSLPMFPELRTDQMDYMVDCIKQFYSVRN
jgi:dTDP-4-amino-4,6-dideoxygalactose transaminase